VICALHTAWEVAPWRALVSFGISKSAKGGDALSASYTYNIGMKHGQASLSEEAQREDSEVNILYADDAEHIALSKAEFVETVNARHRSCRDCALAPVVSPPQDTYRVGIFRKIV
jgi:hypothetical protein